MTNYPPKLTLQFSKHVALMRVKDLETFEHFCEAKVLIISGTDIELSSSIKEHPSSLNTHPPTHGYNDGSTLFFRTS